MAEKFSLKDSLFNKTKVEKIAGEIKRVYPDFDKAKFVREVISKFPELELKARITWIADCLKKYLPGDYEHTVGILVKALPDPNDPHLSDNDFGDFIYAPYSEFVAKYGCSKEHLRTSLKALYEITQRFSAEDAIRYFINAFPKETMKELQSWAKDSHYHVRRLCSEGARPKLPWSQKIAIPVTAPIPILDKLFSDKTRFVTRSVANHINDISKTHPDLAMDTLAKWKKSGKQNETEMEFIIQHGLRTLVKQGNAKAMNLLGYSDAPKVKILKFNVPKQVVMNTRLEFSAEIKSEEETNIVVDYIIYFQNKSGKLNSKKVFKLTKLALKRGESIVVSKRHMLLQYMTTRTLYPGKHEIEIQVNGMRLAKDSFLLK